MAQGLAFPAALDLQPLHFPWGNKLPQTPLSTQGTNRSQLLQVPALLSPRELQAVRGSCIAPALILNSPLGASNWADLCTGLNTHVCLSYSVNCSVGLHVKKLREIKSFSAVKPSLVKKPKEPVQSSPEGTAELHTSSAGRSKVCPGSCQTEIFIAP